MDILSDLNFVLSVIIGLLLLVLLVVIHELGHALVARRNGVVVEEFGIGFPPRAWKRKLKNGVLFTLNWLPLGGFVKLQGEHDAATGPGDYGAASLWAKARILLAGVFINWLAAAILFTILALAGLPKIIPDQFTVQGDSREVKQAVSIATVVGDSPAEKAGIKNGDKILRFNGQPVADPADLNSLAKQLHGKSVEIIYSRANVEHAAHVSLNDTNSAGKGYLGVASQQQSLVYSTWSAPVVGVVLTGQLTKVTLEGLGSTLSNLVVGAVEKVSPSSQTRTEGGVKLGDVANGVAGPIAILGIIFPSAREAGISSLLFITAIISLTLAVMNALPIPALDGGRLFVTILFRILKQPLTKEREERIHGTGFMVLMALVLLVTIADIGKIGR